MFSFFANPQRFMALSGALLPWLTGLAVALFAVGLPWALIFAPPDYQQGDSARIMFVHVPSAWLASLVYVIMAVASVVSLVWRHALADVAAKAAAPLGAVFTAGALITGSLWGEPTWGTWWVWDARLTSVLVLFFLYLGYMALWAAIEDEQKAARAAAILCLVGAINIPIINRSVEWWNTLHQPASIFRAGGPSMHESLLYPLLVNALAFSVAFAALHLAAMRVEILKRRAASLEARLG
jgi:heme exporter protein C